MPCCTIVDLAQGHGSRSYSGQSMQHATIYCDHKKIVVKAEPLFTSYEESLLSPEVVSARSQIITSITEMQFENNDKGCGG